MVLFVFQEEVKFLSHSSVNHHPNLVKLIGFSSNGYRCKGPMNGVVYDLNPLDTLYNHTPKGIQSCFYGSILNFLTLKLEFTVRTSGIFFQSNFFRMCKLLFRRYTITMSFC